MQLPVSNGIDDTAVINTALGSASEVVGLPGETYRISAPLGLRYSRTHLSMESCGVDLLGGSDCNMVKNVSGSVLTDVTISGGTWNRGSNGGVGNDNHSLFLRGFKRLTVRDLRVTSAGGKYAVAIGATEGAQVTNLSFDTASDGVHITGPARDVVIRDVRGRTSDDMVAFTGRDYVHYDDVHGDITGAVVEGVFPDGSLAALKVVSGDGARVSGLSASRIYGTTQIRPISIQADQTGPTVADGITLADLDVQATDPDWAIIWLRGVTSTDIEIRDVRVRRLITGRQMVMIDQNGRIGSLSLDNWIIGPDAGGPADIVGLYGSMHLGTLRICRVRHPVSWSGIPYRRGGTSVADSVSVSDVTVVNY